MTQGSAPASLSPEHAAAFSAIERAVGDQPYMAILFQTNSDGTFYPILTSNLQDPEEIHHILQTMLDAYAAGASEAIPFPEKN